MSINVVNEANRAILWQQRIKVKQSKPVALNDKQARSDRGIANPSPKNSPSKRSSAHSNHVNSVNSSQHAAASTRLVVNPPMQLAEGSTNLRTKQNITTRKEATETTCPKKTTTDSKQPAITYKQPASTSKQPIMTALQSPTAAQQSAKTPNQPVELPKYARSSSKVTCRAASQSSSTISTPKQCEDSNNPTRADRQSIITKLRPKDSLKIIPPGKSDKASILC